MGGAAQGIPLRHREAAAPDVVDAGGLPLAAPARACCAFIRPRAPATGPDGVDVRRRDRAAARVTSPCRLSAERRPAGHPRCEFQAAPPAAPGPAACATSHKTFGSRCARSSAGRVHGRDYRDLRARHRCQRRSSASPTRSCSSGCRSGSSRLVMECRTPRLGFHATTRHPPTTTSRRPCRARIHRRGHLRFVQSHRHRRAELVNPPVTSSLFQTSASAA